MGEDIHAVFMAGSSQIKELHKAASHVWKKALFIPSTMILRQARNLQDCQASLKITCAE
jgi:hypothetical protein